VAFGILTNHPAQLEQISIVADTLESSDYSRLWCW